MAIRYLTDICDIQYGFAFDASGFTTSAEEGMPLVRIRDVMNGRTETYFKGNYPQEYIIHKGDFLVGMDGEFNIAPWKSDDALLNQRVCRVKSNQSGVSTKFLFWFLKKELKRIEDETPFVTVKHLSAKRLKQVQLEVPSIQEQEKIVAELDCLSSIIEKKKQQLKELDNLAQSIFYDMFGDPITNEKGWEVEKLGNLTVLFNGRAFKPNDWSETGLPIVRIQNLNDPLAPYNFYNGQTEEKYLLHGGELLYAWSGTPGTSFGAHIWDGQEAVLNQHIFKVEFNQSLLNKSYFLFHLNSSVRHLFDFTHGGVGLKHITKGTLTSQIVPLPPIDKQNAFAQKIEAIEKQKELIKKSIQETETIFNSRMDYWFN